MWRYSGSTWTWISGKNITDVYRVVGQIGVASPGSFPGGIADTASFLDVQGSLWIMSKELFWNWNGTVWVTVGYNDIMWDRSNPAVWVKNNTALIFSGSHFYGNLCFE